MIAPASLEILQEMINMGVGRGAQVLNTLLSHHVELSVPQVTETTPAGLLEALGIDARQTLSCVQMGYGGSLEGQVQLLFPLEAATQMVNLIIGDQYVAEELDFVRQATLTEVGNIVINAVVGTISNLFGLHLTYTLPSYRGGTLEAIEDQDHQRGVQVILLAKTTFTISALSITGNMLMFFSLPSFERLEEALGRYATR